MTSGPSAIAPQKGRFVCTQYIENMSSRAICCWSIPDMSSRSDPTPFARHGMWRTSEPARSGVSARENINLTNTTHVFFTLQTNYSRHSLRSGSRAFAGSHLQRVRSHLHLPTHSILHTPRFETLPVDNFNFCFFSHVDKQTHASSTFTP